MKVCLMLVLAALCLAGCGSPNVNPSKPHANTGYVDLYTDSDLVLGWEVKRGAEQSTVMRTVFNEFDPVIGNILRLAAPNGTYRFQVWFINRLTTGPQTVTVQIINGKVTPVHVTLTSIGTSDVTTTTRYEYRTTVRATRAVPIISTGPQTTYQISLTAAAPQDYQPKEQTAYYAALPAK
jgi:hypothetical protein